MKVETFVDPSGNWGILVDGMMDCDIPWFNKEYDLVVYAVLAYPGCTVITTEHPDHYSNQGE